jgi:hypothetical protein
MNSRTDQLPACRIDLALILLPLVGRQDAARMLAHHDVPLTIAKRVLIEPSRRRAEERGSASTAGAETASGA